MAFPTTSTRNLAGGVVAEAKAIKQQCQSAISALAAGPQSANAIIGLCQRLNASKVNVFVPAQGSSAVLAALASDLGLADAAAANSAIQGVVDAITGSIDWVVANFPTSGGSPSYILKDTLNADGSVSVRSFTSAQTAGLRTQLQGIVDAIG